MDARWLLQYDQGYSLLRNGLSKVSTAFRSEDPRSMDVDWIGKEMKKVNNKERIVFKEGFLLPDNITEDNTFCFWLNTIYPPLSNGDYEACIEAYEKEKGRKIFKDERIECYRIEC